MARDVLNLLLCIDRGTGTVLRAPVAQPAQAYASITDTVWAAAALDRLGYTDAAGRALSRFLDAVRTTADDGFPAGSLPAHILCDGRPARFDAAADPASAAWLLAACWRHAQALPGGGAVAYLRQHWPVLSACADFLAFAPGPGRTLAGGTLLPDGSTAMLDTHFLGLECARRIALALGQAEPTPWGDRWSELYTRIRARGLDATSGPPAGDTWVAHWVATLGDGATEDRGWEILLRGEAAPPDTSRPETPELPNARLHALRCPQAFP